MCVSPLQLPNGSEVACRNCWQCHDNKINDWVGRCIAESKTADSSYSVTLTYGRDGYGNSDHERAAVLTYSDVQKYFRSMRDAGYKVRYFAVGEYGHLKGRAHWHAILFFTGAAAPHELTISKHSAKRFENEFWPHGYQHWEAISPASIRYVCKYINKNMGKQERQGHLAMSKKPPLGALYFRQLAERLVEQGLAPVDLKYRFPESKRKDGSPQEYLLWGRSAEMFLDYYAEAWEKKNAGVLMPYSERLSERMDQLCAFERATDAEFDRTMNVHSVAEYPTGVRTSGARPVFDYRHNMWTITEAGETLYWRFHSTYKTKSWQKGPGYGKKA